MLQQLIAEAENKAVVFSDDLSSATRQQHLQGLQACQEDDVQHKNWLIALVNAQVSVFLCVFFFVFLCFRCLLCFYRKVFYLRVNFLR